ncbi:MAG: hypothetical protein ACI4QH_03930, partial [Candidatus Fimimonas sp.]
YIFQSVTPNLFFRSVKSRNGKSGVAVQIIISMFNPFRQIYHSAALQLRNAKRSAEKHARFFTHNKKGYPNR